jgi:hypothetical protein
MSKYGQRLQNKVGAVRDDRFGLVGNLVYR